MVLLVKHATHQSRLKCFDRGTEKLTYLLNFLSPAIQHSARLPRRWVIAGFASMTVEYTVALLFPRGSSSGMYLPRTVAALNIEPR
jgi:hypothetical protein